MGEKTPLAVDVDGTLVRGNLLGEGISRLLASSPASVFALPWWLLGGRANLKRKVAERAIVAPEALNLNATVVAEMQAAKAAGRELWLASGADHAAVAPLARAVGAHGTLASDGRRNLVGAAKAAALTARFGKGGFDYIGNGRRDLAVWRTARRAIGVDVPPRVAASLRALHGDAKFLVGKPGTAADHWRALRPHHWVKNALVFAPLLAAHNLTLGAWLPTLAMFIALCACASAGYVANDLIDLPHDRGHAGKRGRPLAAGTVRVGAAAAIGGALAIAGVALAAAIAPATGLLALSYLGLTLAYSLWLKRRVFIDVIALSALYAVRVAAGGAAAGVALSSWFVGFLLFAFLALAVLKRLSELKGLIGRAGAMSAGRGYLAEDLATMTALGAASGFASAVVLGLYIQSERVATLYARPEALWLICPLLIHWLGRAMLLANRGQVDDDPVAFALSDRVSWLTAAGMVAAFLAAL